MNGWGRLALVAVLLGASSAQAGRRAFLWTYDTETLPEGTVEIEQWLWFRALAPRTGDTTGWIWFSPVYGATDFLELAVPWELLVNREGAQITNFTLETRWNFLDRLEEHFVRPVLRVGYQHNFDHPDNAGRWGVPWGRINLSVSLGDPKASHFTIDAGVYSDFLFGKRQVIGQTVGLGYTFEVVEHLRIGFEYFHDLGFGDLNREVYRVSLGPTIGFSRQRFWATGGALINVLDQGPRLTPRLLIGIAL